MSRIVPPLTNTFTPSPDNVINSCIPRLQSILITSRIVTTEREEYQPIEVTIMRKTLWINLVSILLFAVLFQPAAVLADASYFDAAGNAVDAAAYEKMASDGQKALSAQLKNGYDAGGVWKDPIRLRQKRIEQWKMMRSSYNPESLPFKIESPATKSE